MSLSSLALSDIVFMGRIRGKLMPMPEEEKKGVYP
jgi:hypothetical protein